MTDTAARSFATLDAAARTWGNARGITGRTGGYLNAAGSDAYAALPAQIRARYSRRNTAAQNRAAVSFGIWDAMRGRSVQGWDSLGRILVRTGAITVDTSGARVRYLVAADVATAQA